MEGRAGHSGRASVRLDNRRAYLQDFSWSEDQEISVSGHQDLWGSLRRFQKDQSVITQGWTCHIVSQDLENGSTVGAGGGGGGAVWAHSKHRGGDKPL